MKLENIAAIGIMLALLWIGYELHTFNSGSISIQGDINASGDMSVSGSLSSTVQGVNGQPIEVEIQR